MPIFRSALSAALLVAAPLTVGGFAVSSAPASAQNALDQFEVTFQAREAQRRATISKAMNFTEAEAEQFWPIYDRYRLDAKAHQLRRLRMIRELSENTADMDAATATSLSMRGLALEEEQMASKKVFIEALAPHISGARFFRMYQLETKLDAIFRFGWTRQIPLAVTEEEFKMLQQDFEMKHAEEEAKAKKSAATT